MKIRITGTDAEVTEAARLLRGLLVVLETSRPYPRRNSRLVSVYLEADLPTRNQHGGGRSTDAHTHPVR